MKTENLVKAALMFGGGFLLFMLAKPKSMPTAIAIENKTKSFDNAPSPTSIEDAEIVANAYAAALNAGETPSRLTELNKELIKEFGMRASLDKQNQLIVADTKGNTILIK